MIAISFQQKVPTGNWFCPECVKKQTPKSPKRKGRRKTFTEEEEELVPAAQEEAPEEPEEEE